MTSRQDDQRWIEQQRETNFTAALTPWSLHMSAPRVHAADVDAAIQHDKTTYTVLPDGRTTVCNLTLDNGFTVRGESACVSIENYNAEIGNGIAFTNAREKVWALLGFRLADKLMTERVA